MLFHLFRHELTLIAFRLLCVERRGRFELASAVKGFGVERRLELVGLDLDSMVLSSSGVEHRVHIRAYSEGFRLELSARDQKDREC